VEPRRYVAARGWETAGYTTGPRAGKKGGRRYSGCSREKVRLVLSENEMYETHGRAHARAKELRSQIATAKAEIGRQSKILAEIGRSTEEFLRDPGREEIGKAPDAFKLVRDLRFELKDTLAQIATLVDDTYARTEELTKLEEQIKNF
jgi:hypothetical protein